jgi:hypothetical protein
MIIPTTQPNGTMVNVLFEPNTTVVDSVTYDITAWSLPYVYGLKAYAVRNAIPLTTGTLPAIRVNNPVSDPYGYVIRWNGMKSVRLVSQLLQKDIRLRYHEQPFTVNNERFERGSVIVLKANNRYNGNLWNEVRRLADSNGVQLTPIGSGFTQSGADFGSSRVRPLLNRKVALFTGEGISSLAAGEVWHFFDRQIDYPVTLININDFARIPWSDYDVIIMPGGTYRFLNDKAQSEQFRNWIQQGGHVIALENATSQLARLEWAIKAKKNEENHSGNHAESLRRYEDRERDYIPTITPGSIFRVELDHTHPLAFGYPDYYYTLKQDDLLYEYFKESGWNVGVLRKNKQVAGFVGSKLIGRLQEGLLFGVQDIGSGTVTYLTDNVMFRSFWENGKLMFSNAVFLVGQ